MTPFPQRRPITLSAVTSTISLGLSFALAVLYIRLLYDSDRGAPIGLPFFVPNAAALAGITAYLSRRGRSAHTAVAGGVVAGTAYMLVFLTVLHYEEVGGLGGTMEALLSIPLWGLLPSIVFLVGIVLSAIWVNLRSLLSGAKDESTLY